jgi:hypothetical protein
MLPALLPEGTETLEAATIAQGAVPLARIS